MERWRKMAFKTFLVRHKNQIIAAMCGLVAGAIAALALLAAILFGYYHVQPQEAVNITITQAVIQGTKEDGSQINGFIITTEDGDEYLITDYWNPILLSEDIPSE